MHGAINEAGWIPNRTSNRGERGSAPHGGCAAGKGVYTEPGLGGKHG